MVSARMYHRLSRHHFPIGIVTLVIGYALYTTRSFPDVLTRLSFASAYPALILLALTLLIGPYKVIARGRPVVSIDFRRDIGIWAGMAGLFHTVVGQCVHLRGRPWLYYIYEKWLEKHRQPFRHDLFGFANYTGLAAALILLALLATSNDIPLRKFGAPGWKQLQRWNYLCFALVAVHTVTYQKGIENQPLTFFGTSVIAILVTVTLQFMGWSRRVERYTPADR
jgi:sulfoxide reductase heme-binding subunit YedZ